MQDSPVLLRFSLYSYARSHNNNRQSQQQSTGFEEKRIKNQSVSSYAGVAWVIGDGDETRDDGNISV